MGISSEQARRLQFSGTEHAYEAAEVEEFRRRVVEALSAHESDDTTDLGAADATDEESLAEAQRIRQQAVQLAERMLREVMGAPRDTVSGLEAWQDAAMLRALAEEEMAYAQEEARRLPAMAAAERDEMHSRYEKERTEVRAELQRELQSSRAAAMAEADSIRDDAASEAEAVLRAALHRVDERQKEAAAEAHRMERRIALLQNVLTDAEARFRRLAATAANEVGTLTALADQDINPAPASAAPGETPNLHLASVDLTDEALRNPQSAEETGETPEPIPQRDPEESFYQRRLAGLRDRLEKSGHPPE